MKKIKVILLFIIMIIISGCSVTTEYNMKIDNNGKVNLSLITAVDKDLIKLTMENNNQSTTEITDVEMIDFFKTSAVINNTNLIQKDYLTDNFIGYEFVTEITLDDISTKEEVLYDLNAIADTFKQEKLFSKVNDIYTATFTFDGNKEINNLILNNNKNNVDIAPYLDRFNSTFKYIVTLPESPIEHNATVVSADGKTLTWELLSNQITNINYKFKLPEKKVAVITDTTSKINIDDQTKLYIAYGSLGLAFILILVLLSNKTKPSSSVSQEKDVVPVKSITLKTNENNFSTIEVLDEKLPVQEDKTN